MLHGDHFRITVEPVIVKRYRKTLVNKGFSKKKLDTRIDTHCIKTGVQLWCGRRDSNPHTDEVTEPKSVESTNSTTPADMGGRKTCRHFVIPLFLHGEASEVERYA